MKPTLSDLETLARSAGQIVLQRFNRRPGFGPQLHIEPKGRFDLVTEADHESEAFVICEIRRRFPDHHIVSEESGILPGNGAGAWYIDPIDGTVNFAHGVPFFSVSIAYEENGVVWLGVVYDPSQDECFSAERGSGAWLNGEPIRASTTEELEQSLLVTGFPNNLNPDSEKALDQFVRLSRLSQGVRRLGSAALDLCYIAAGRCDGFWEVHLNAWDVAAGGLIAEEAGAIVTDLEGGHNYLSHSLSMIAAAPGLHPQLIAALRE